jgi:hypothetical protein
MYFETQVIFTEEIPTKNGIKEKKTRRQFLVECDSVTVAETKVNEHLKDSPYSFETKVVKESKIVGVIE